MKFKSSFLKYLSIMLAAAAVLALCGFAFGVFKSDKEDESAKEQEQALSPLDDPSNWVKLGDNPQIWTNDDIVSGGLYKYVPVDQEIILSIDVYFTDGWYDSSNSGDETDENGNLVQGGKRTDALRFFAFSTYNLMSASDIFFYCPYFILPSGSEIYGSDMPTYFSGEIYRYIGPAIS